MSEPRLPDVGAYYTPPGIVDPACGTGNIFGDDMSDQHLFTPGVVSAANELTKRFPFKPCYDEQVLDTARVIQEVIDIHYQSLVAEAAKSAALQWNRRPTRPGVYVCWSGSKSQFPLTAVALTEGQIMKGAPFGDVISVLGPLPPMPCEDCRGFGTPSGEAAGLVCGNCMGSGLEPEETPD